VVEKLWLTRPEALTLIGRSAEYFRNNIQAALPPGHIRRAGGRGNPWQFYGPAVVKVLLVLNSTPSTEADPLLSGSDSPALERFRLARAEREELELAVRREHLIDVDEFLAWWDAEVAIPIRKGLEKLQKKHGSKAVDLVSAAVRQSEAVVSRRFHGK